MANRGALTGKGREDICCTKSATDGNVAVDVDAILPVIRRAETDEPNDELFFAKVEKDDARLVVATRKLEIPRGPPAQHK